MELWSRTADYKTASWSLYRYLPNEPAAILFVVLFGLATIFHFWKLFRTKTWFFIAFCIGGICKMYHQTSLNLADIPTSRGSWLRWTRCQCYAVTRLGSHAIHHSVVADPCRPGLVCSEHVHDAGTNHPHG